MRPARRAPSGSKSVRRREESRQTHRGHRDFPLWPLRRANRSGSCCASVCIGCVGPLPRRVCRARRGTNPRETRLACRAAARFALPPGSHRCARWPVCRAKEVLIFAKHRYLGQAHLLLGIEMGLYQNGTGAQRRRDGSQTRANPIAGKRERLARQDPEVSVALPAGCMNSVSVTVCPMCSASVSASSVPRCSLRGTAPWVARRSVCQTSQVAPGFARPAWRCWR